VLETGKGAKGEWNVGRRGRGKIGKGREGRAGHDKKPHNIKTKFAQNNTRYFHPLYCFYDL